MCNEIKSINFDIAFLSCATYALYLGDYISNVMKKKAIYIGGYTNVFFNIKSERYNNMEKFSKFMNMDYNIEALEKPKYSLVKSGRGIKNEGFLAYGF